MQEIQVQQVSGTVRQTIPTKNQQIDELIDIKNFPFNYLKQLEIYRRSKEDCPFNRGNWVIDITFKNGQINFVKLPLEMAEEAVNHYCEPLINKLEEWKSKNETNQHNYCGVYAAINRLRN
jgi:hypothetical protein